MEGANTTTVNHRRAQNREREREIGLPLRECCDEIREREDVDERRQNKRGKMAKNVEGIHVHSKLWTCVETSEGVMDSHRRV